MGIARQTQRESKNMLKTRSKEDKTCIQKIKELNQLVNSVVKQTKKDTMMGRKAELRYTKNVLRTLLGRDPTFAEIELASMECWPNLDEANCCRNGHSFSLEETIKNNKV